MQDSRGLGLAEAQVTDYGLGNVREAGGCHITEDPERRCEEAACTLQALGAQPVPADV